MNRRPRYFIDAVLISLLVIPVVMSGAVFFILGFVSSFPALLLIAPLLATVLIWIWFFWCKRKVLPPTWFQRLIPLVIAPCWYLLAWNLTLALSGLSFAAFGGYSLLQSIYLIATGPWFVINLFLIFGGGSQLFVLIQLATLVLPILILCITVALNRRNGKKTGSAPAEPSPNPQALDTRAVAHPRASLAVLGVVVCLVLALAPVLLFARSQIYLPYVYQSELVGVEPLPYGLYDYQPFSPQNKLTALPGKAPFTIESNYPRLDGATAAYPVYAALAQGFYRGLDEQSVNEYVRCSTTPEAYQRLINGEVDLIFGAQPSKGQLDSAKAAGVTLKTTPIGREAFVFFVNEDNPIDSLTLEQIQDIYQKKITNWNELGGTNLDILAFQRPEDSGSQTIMLAKVMDGKPMAMPLRTESIGGMGGMINEVAEYRNDASAIGYSFRYYTVGMNPHDDIKLLAINGVEPSLENIQNGSYPFTIDVYAVTAETTNPHVPKLIDWLLSNQGQAFIEDSGYIPLA